MKLALALAATIAATPALAQALKMDDVPQHVRATAMAAANAGKIDSVQIDMDGGKAIFEFKVTMADGKKAEIDVDHTGSIEEVEEVIDRGAVPAPVMQTLMRMLPNFQPTLVEKSTRGNFEVYYEFEGKDPRGTEVDIEVRADGRLILIAEDTAN